MAFNPNYGENILITHINSKPAIEYFEGRYCTERSGRRWLRGKQVKFDNYWNGNGGNYRFYDGDNTFVAYAESITFVPGSSTCQKLGCGGFAENYSKIFEVKMTKDVCVQFDYAVGGFYVKPDDVVDGIHICLPDGSIDTFLSQEGTKTFNTVKEWEDFCNGIEKKEPVNSTKSLIGGLVNKSNKEEFSPKKYYENLLNDSNVQKNFKERHGYELGERKTPEDTKSLINGLVNKNPEPPRTNDLVNRNPEPPRTNKNCPVMTDDEICKRAEREVILNDITKEYHEKRDKLWNETSEQFRYAPDATKALCEDLIEKKSPKEWSIGDKCHYAYCGNALGNTPELFFVKLGKAQEIIDEAAKHLQAAYETLKNAPQELQDCFLRMNADIGLSNWAYCKAISYWNNGGHTFKLKTKDVFDAPQESISDIQEMLDLHNSHFEFDGSGSEEMARK